MDRPLVFELNTRCRLRELSDNADREITLATVPDAEFLRWKKFGFTHLWLMGIWTTGPKSRNAACERSDLRALAAEAFETSDDTWLGSSPYAIADYAVASSLGGLKGLRHFRKKLGEYGIGLLLDFVPNHVGPDHSWVESKPELFVQSAMEKPETFPVKTSNGTVWLARGRDPYFPAWDDTVQLDYRNQSPRNAMIEVLKSVANECDGVRCDMAMLVLNDVFDRTWHDFPPTAPIARSEFWPEAIAAVRKTRPTFQFIAEAYWNLEPRLQSLGFDFIYDKAFYDELVRRDSDALREHIKATDHSFNPVRFLENHDEPRIASLLSLEEHKAAAILLMNQPGMRLLHDGQLIGRKQRTPVQFERYWPEPPDPEITDFYQSLLCKKPKR